jgi:hypothetical protein
LGERIKSFQLALRLAPEIQLETMVGPRFRLRDYREAIGAARSAGRNGHIRVVFDHRGVRPETFPTRGRKNEPSGLHHHPR